MCSSRATRCASPASLRALRRRGLPRDDRGEVVCIRGQHGVARPGADQRAHARRRRSRRDDDDRRAGIVATRELRELMHGRFLGEERQDHVARALVERLGEIVRRGRSARLHVEAGLLQRARERGVIIRALAEEQHRLGGVAGLLRGMVSCVHGHLSSWSSRRRRLGAVVTRS